MCILHARISSSSSDNSDQTVNQIFESETQYKKEFYCTSELAVKCNLKAYTLLALSKGI